jgi:fermentation-respiration switch protein FrsA (DUF1100 family)
MIGLRGRDQPWLDYDAQASASHLTSPLLVVHSDAAASPESVREFVALVPGFVEQAWLDGVTQYDFYDQPGPVETAAGAAARFFSASSRSFSSDGDPVAAV